MTMSHKAFCLAFTLLLGCEAGFATRIPFTYGQGENLEFGTQKKENYDVALRILPGQFSGGNIVGITVPVLSSDISNVHLWLSSELKVELVDGKNKTVPDILDLEAHVSDGVATVMFDAPVPIPGDGVYVGYSFDIDNLSEDAKWPLFMSKSDSEEGFYMRSSRSYREWKNFSTEMRAATELAAIVDYDFAPESVGLVSVDAVRTDFGKAFTVPAVIENHGCEEVSSIDFDYKFGDEAGSTHFELPKTLPAIYGRRLNVDLPFGVCQERFNNVLDITITKVNGKENLDPAPSAKGAVNIVTHSARHRVVLEEYTGTWCGFCVKGTAAVQRMLSLYPDDFIPLVYHGGSSDPMYAVGAFPNEIPGFPHSWMERAFDCDPYDGLYGDEFFGMERTFLERREIPAPADVEVKAYLDTDNNVNVSTNVEFVEIPNSQYMLGYALLEDGMRGSGPAWAQSNYYAGKDPSKYIPEMERFCTGDSYIIDIDFNEVVVMAPDIMGVKGSVAFTEAGTPINHEYIFYDLKSATNVFGAPIIQNFDNLSVVALLIDSDNGHIVNAAKTKLDTSAVDTIADNARSIRDITWLTLDGKKVSTPSTGINIKLTRYSDGTTRTEKVVCK